MLPATVFALGNTPEYLCGHTHDADCGYVEGDEGTPCAHAHDANCGYVEGSPCSDVHIHDASCDYVEGASCTYVHIHNESCGYVEGAPCTYVHTHSESCGYCEGSACTYVHIHNESCGYCEGSSCTYEHVHDDTCGYNAETGEGCTDTHTHDESCGYAEASPCTDAHTHDENCGYTEVSDCTDVHIHDDNCGFAEASPCTDAHVHGEDCGYIAAAPCTYSHTHDASCGYIGAVACNHVHDASCGYSEPMLAVPCSHICEILSFNDYTPGEAIDVYAADAGETYDDICAALPETLPGMLACAEGDVDIPLRWSCADFTGEAGEYIFHAELENEHCAYAVADDELTEDVDESELPFITVTVPEAAAPAPTTAPTNSTYTISDDTNTVTVTGLMPEGAYLKVDEVDVKTARELLGESETAVLFAYDIKIMLPGALDEATGEYGEPTEYQPTAEQPVTVTITPPEPIEAPTVEIVHIAEDAETGEKTPQPVATVAPTENTIEFEAEGFSVYVVTIGTVTPRVTFSYDDASLNVEYCTTSDGTYATLDGDTDNAVSLDSSVDVLYFKVTGGTVAGVYHNGTTAMTADSNSVYTVDNITANTIITIGTAVALNVTYGKIVIGENDGSGERKYTYSDTNGAQTGTHLSSNIYCITGTTGTDSNGGGYNISLTGEGDFNVVLSNVTIYTGIPGGSYIGEGIYAPVSTSGVTGAGNINITLEETNTLANVSENPSDSYAALEKTNSDSTLIINGNGTLNATGGADSAGIGSSDKTNVGTKNITINSGTISATTKGSQGAGIGSGNNKPAENIRIYGGNINATGFDNGAGIGGSGSANFTATSGQVYIYGGTINATSNGTGAGIGGGGSRTGVDATGGAGEVHIYGGTITADSIGGGDGGNGGGNATVEISGGKVTTDGSIGGGNSSQGSGGEATITISGGTITAANISGGHGVGGAHAGGTLSVTGGSAKVEHVCPAITTTGVGSGAPLTYNVYVANEGNAVPNAKVTAIDITPPLDPASYGLNDVYTDAVGRLYLWLPSGTTVNRVTVDIGGTPMSCTTMTDQAAASITFAATTGYIAHDEELTAHLSYGTATEWRWEKHTGNTWTAIGGATSEKFIPGILNVGEIRVVINNIYVSHSVFVSPPQLSIAVPTNTVITVNAAGQCTVSGGTITNTNVVPVYLTEVSYEWETDGENDAHNLFTRWATNKPIPTLTLGSDSPHSFEHEGNDVIPWSDINAEMAVGGTIALNWAFDLNGNSLAFVPQSSVQIATVTYTVGLAPTTP